MSGQPTLCETIVPRLLKMFPGGGWFVEAGAHDGIGDSVTLPLEKAGWDGLCIEPSSAFHGLIHSGRRRVDSACLSGKDREVMTFREMRGEKIELSGLAHSFCDGWDRSEWFSERKVMTVTIDRVLDDHGAPAIIRFLCLDTEGSEVEILAANDMTRHLFLSILVEHNGVEVKWRELAHLLYSRSYRLMEDDGRDMFAVHVDALERWLA